MAKRWDVLARLCRKYGFTSGAEIGVADGRFTQGLLSALPELHLLAVDYWPVGYPTWDGLEWPADLQKRNRASFMNVMRQFPRLTLMEMPSVAASSCIADGALDFVFIDALHDYDAVKADICAWLPKVREGGFITGHDYDRLKFPGVIQAVDEFFPRIKLQEDYVWMAQRQT